MKNLRPRRSKRRFPCVFVANEQRYHGIVLDVSRTGMFVQTDATIPPGTRLELDLIATGNVPDLEMRGVVTRRRVVPALLANAVQRGIGVRILEAPREWGLAFQLEPLDAPIREASAPASRPAPPRDDPAEDETGSGAPARRRRAWRWGESRSLAPKPTPEHEDGRPEALVIDSGDLDDVHALLDEMRIDVQVVQPGRSGALEPEVRPKRLLVTSARLALSGSWPVASGDGVVAIAVADDDTHTLTAQMRRLGFQYLVSRPVHPQALRLLLRQALYRGGERRRAARHAFGCEVEWRSGIWRRPGTLAEISSAGCRLLSRLAVELGAAARITIPAADASGRRLTLRGHVVRRERTCAETDDERVALGVAFDTLSAGVRRRLELLLQKRGMGPAMLQRDEAARAAERATPETASGTPQGGAAREPAAVEQAASHDASGTASEPAETELAAEAAAPPQERREQPRGVLDREVVALDEGRRRVVQTLVGRDLSRGGMRIDPHPGVTPGVRLCVALYEQAQAEPLVLDAEVTRDDDERGLLLGFRRIDAASLERIERIVAQLPPVQKLRPQPHRVVLGSILMPRSTA
jgi:hypothetical protein